jgi:trehalose synthase
VDKPEPVVVGVEQLERYAPIIGPERMARAIAVATEFRQLIGSRVIWNLSSTAAGGGVAEMLRPLLGYARGLGVDARWMVIHGPPEFFHITKRIHHALHGEMGDGSSLESEERMIYERTLNSNAAELNTMIRPHDVVIAHDPQTAGLVPELACRGAIVIWRCHIGTEHASKVADRGWAFLAPYLADAHALVFSRGEYVPEYVNRGRAVVITPTIDALSPKNQMLSDETVRAILVGTGLVEGPAGPGTSAFLRQDGTPGRVDRKAEVMRLGQAPTWETPLIVQVSRWDALKDPIGVLQGFALVDAVKTGKPELVLAGPQVRSVADDPEATTVLEEVAQVWRNLPDAVRSRVHLVSLPMEDLEENAAIVNALQRHAAVVVQKSLHEGFGLSVTEAMWKGRPVVASAVGGIQDQIRDGIDGILLRDARDLPRFAAALETLLVDRDLAARLGASAHIRVLENYLGVHSLLNYAALIERIDRDLAGSRAA